MGSTRTFSVAQNRYNYNAYTDARRLLDWAFSLYAYRLVLRQRDAVMTRRVELSATNDEITVVPREDVRALLPANANIATEVTRDINFHYDRLVAPIEQGDVLGEITLLFRGEIVGSTQLLANASIAPSNVLYALDRIRQVVERPWFIASVIIFAVMFSVYMGMTLLRSSRREQKRFR